MIIVLVGVDDRVRDLLRVKFQLGLFDHPYVEDAAKSEKIVNSERSRSR